ncbi:hypothetical protein A4D02_32910 [Niastella koreensis]|uniref:Uncharacterized protein n=2 Tax=Niastella koreensis TaxID=354356 RepID=G8T8Q0_NIAKG|nr:DUF6266 family protein [Niastella koreensis]AEW01230.1 hypothetical protein Niako_4990 [Niastella koreensis GR20-10]OQP45994.1 hypothetical protein A4D02_32910 [Niastella koreensis]
MAYQINLFNFTGTLGNVVGYYYKGKYCLRSRAVRKNQNVSLKQLIQQEKFGLAGRFVRCLTPVFAQSIPDHKKMTKSNFVMSSILRNAITGTYPDFRIDYSQVQVSRGHLQNEWDGKAIAASEKVIFTWGNNSLCHGNAKGDDKAILVVYCEALNQCVYSMNEINRSAGCAALPVSIFKGHKVETWIGFISANRKLISNSIYTGPLFIT